MKKYNLTLNYEVTVVNEEKFEKHIAEQVGTREEAIAEVLVGFTKFDMPFEGLILSDEEDSIEEIDQ